jgi:hypothetical protein
MGTSPKQGPTAKTVSPCLLEPLNGIEPLACALRERRYSIFLKLIMIDNHLFYR